MSLVTRLAIAAAVAAALGFPVFVWSLTRASFDPERADAIVALTGGEGRLVAGIHLLERAKGERLLISGVHADTSREELFAAVGQLPANLACCVDLGRSAADTIGNAGETAAWVRENGYRSIIVVTASYHMPRSLLELRAVLPETKFVPYAVFPDRVKLDQWWNDPETTSVLVGEYGKFLASAARLGVATATGSGQTPDAGSYAIERGQTPVEVGPATPTAGSS
jgi:uncharacterized SAM-binding protein YcdF (DUF218 family)